MSKDTDSNIFSYWPISGLQAGHDSDVLTFTELTPVPRGYLRAKTNDLINVFARRKGVGASYVNIETTPIALDSMPAGDTEFEIYVHALALVEDGFALANCWAGVTKADPAGWQE